MAWTDLSFSAGSVLTGTKMTQLDENFDELAAQDAGAPLIVSKRGFAVGSLSAANSFDTTEKVLMTVNLDTLGNRVRLEAVFTGRPFTAAVGRNIEARFRVGSVGGTIVGFITGGWEAAGTEVEWGMVTGFHQPSPGSHSYVFTLRGTAADSYQVNHVLVEARELPML